MTRQRVSYSKPYGTAAPTLARRMDGARLRLSVLFGGFALLVVAALLGCDRSGGSGGSGGGATGETDSSSAVRFANPVGSLKIASRSGRWTEAWEASEAILAEAGIDPTDKLSIDEDRLRGIEAGNLLLMARAAHENQHSAASVVFLQAACQNDAFSDASRVQQTTIAMIDQGLYFEGLAFLERALEAQPDQDESRRWLFDFYIGADDRIAALPHGHQLVLKRKFDLELLTSLSNTERRTLDPKPLDTMVSRNPDDKRPLIGTAKGKFDESKYAEAIELLDEIVAQHPDHHPSQALLGRALIAAGQGERMASWAADQTDGIQDYPGYWIALGDWARERGDRPTAIRCFAEAAGTDDGDVVQIWTRLAALLAAQRAEQAASTDEQWLSVVNGRAERLTRFHQLKDRFTRTGQVSRQIAMQIAETLVPLGRLWEAEAWASIATTLPEDDSVDVEAFRKQTIAKLAEKPEWRLASSLPDFATILTTYPLPSIEKVVSSQSGSQRKDSDRPVVASGPSPNDGEVVPWKLDDEAGSRGLEFWGRTSDTLDQAGIMLYQTLGCGGGTIDFDLDGWSDLYLVAAGGRPPAQDSDANDLFRNQDGRFVSAGASSGTSDRGFGQGVAVGDVNEDGFPDLLVLNYGPNRLLINNGDGTFGEANDRLPAEPDDEWSSSAAIADLDADGRSDIVIVNYCAHLDPVEKACPMKDSDVIRSCSPMLFAAAPDRFLKSDGRGVFAEATERWEAQTESPGRGLGIIIGDLDAKRGNEVFIANDMTNNHYWSRRGDDDTDWVVTESATLRGLSGDDRGIAQGSMGIATADFDHDGDADFYVTNFDKEYNTLHLQMSSGIWQDRTAAAGMVDSTTPLVGFGTEAIDLDNDGDHEIVLTNGHVDLFSRGDEQALYDQPAQIFRRSAEGRFDPVAVSSLGSYFAKTHVGRGLWTLDVDRDGRLDFAITHQTEPIALIINRSEAVGNWVRLKLVGRKSSRDAVGSTVKVQSPRGTLTEFRVSGHGYQCSNDPVLHFGLGAVEASELAVSVTWPTGETEQFDGIPTREESVLVQSLR